MRLVERFCGRLQGGVLFVGHGLAPFVRAVGARGLEGHVAHPTVGGGTVPVLHVGRDVHHITRDDLAGGLSPLLVPALAVGAQQDLPAARKAVARIVGRDTQNLTVEGVTKAAVETVAENASDGVIAPLLYMLLGGAPLALTYKAINTMDSMLGYKNQKYLYFGRAAARLDDVANYLPSRLAGLLWVAAAALTGSSARGAWKIWRRDRRNHASPNSAQTESACAGALGVQLAGPAYYFGEYYDKPTIGDALRPVEPKDILRADRMMYAESLLALVLGVALRLLVLAM